MKKILCLLTTLLIFALVSCDFNAPLRNKMLNYYSQDDVYAELSGKIKNTRQIEEKDLLYLEIELSSSHHTFKANAETGYYEFAFVDWSDYEFDLKENDFITFSSAPMHFYNGHFCPIVHLEKNGKELLPLSEGVEKYLSWITDTFN